MLASLSLPSLESRRTIAKLKLFHDIINENKNISKNMIPKRQRCKDVRFQPIYASLKSYANSYFPQVVSLWNKIPASTANITDLKDFRKNLNKLDI